MQRLSQLLCVFVKDEAGAVVSAELVVLGTVCLVGATVGLRAVSKAVNEELVDVACAIRSLDQSYSYPGFCSGGAWSAGSSFIQEPAEVSVLRLREWSEQQLKREEQPKQAKPSPEQKAEHKRQRQTRKHQKLNRSNQTKVHHREGHPRRLPRSQNKQVEEQSRASATHRFNL